MRDMFGNEAADDAKVKRGERQSIDELRAKHGPNWGLGGLDAIDSARGIDDDREKAKAELDRRVREFVDSKILAEYARLEQEPVYASGGMLVSPSLVAALKTREARR